MNGLECLFAYKFSICPVPEKGFQGIIEVVDVRDDDGWALVFSVYGHVA